MMINFAHRGASQYAPENTMSAFFMGIEMGANGIETDIQQSADGVLVLHHDEKLLRTAGIDKPLCELTFAELSKLDMGSFKSPLYVNERIVPLNDFLYYFSGKPLYFALEIKQAGIERKVLQAVRKYLTDDRFTVTSFMLDSLLVLSQEEKKPRLGYLAREYSIELLDTLQKNGIEEFCPNAAWLTAEMVLEVRSRHMGLRAWGVKTEELMIKMCSLGVDGMTVNFPDALARYLQKEERRP